ncbi:hypothetical protein COCSUDRAFT_64738 [Coccomyxa subellipsoidea C-169]|uniref:BZIP domain-containing protein n=1 Tax=Coccomyxa subellipsoidea (strain C-169) TaxID=574566 RepID=I0Z8J6_COCSC|nr:hypothetical protein COCSUDRAFT_64738 [Coccomyxa subellipsoidea C-169]EIE26965.1 hypothetical protein COCSUDRAFT_64738 [Coccomyxa subellipsoidea C-169]|eukprot:XP_005651509.1 hypothetical protein COCSUDRAFT_64738 [Coccomyxa subellipsoidea C-169]
MHRWQQYNGDLDGDVQPRHNSGPLDIDALLQLASQSIYPHDPIDGSRNALENHQLLDPDPPQALFPRDAPSFHGPPPHSFAGDVLLPPQRSLDPVPASPSVQSSVLRSPVGSGEWPGQLGKTRRSQGRPAPQADPQDGSSSDDREGGMRGSKQSDDPNALTALREKNRRAQRKFRERQKQKLAESEGRARDLQLALERLKMEKSALETRNALLEKMAGMKPGDRQPPQIEEVTGRGCAADTAEEAVCTGAADGAANASLRDTLPPSQNTIHLTVRNGRPGLRSGEGTLALSPEQIRSLPQCELAALWKDYVNALTGLLQEARGDDSCPAGQRIGQLIVEVRLVLSGLMSYNPKRWSTLRAFKMDPKGQAPLLEAPPADWSRNMFRAMKLTSRQRQAAVGYRNQLLLRMGGTLRARRDISLEILRTLGGPSTERVVGDLQGGTAMAQGLHVASNAAEALRRNIMEEQQLYNQFLNAIRTIVLPIQSAIAIVQAYPWCPDALAIFNCAAQEEGAPPAHELLACPVPPGVPNLLMPDPPQLPRLKTAGA